MAAAQSDVTGAEVTPWRAVFVAALWTWAATRLGLILLTYFGGQMIAYARAANPGALWSWARWDTGWYLAISQGGYATRTEANFFPLLPALTGAISWLLGDGNPPVSGHDSLRLVVMLAVSNLGALAGFFGIAMLAARGAGGDGGRGGAWRALRVAAAYPFAFFLAAAYTEGLALGAVALALLWSRQGRWVPAVAAGVIAGLTRSTALILVLPMAWEFARQRGWWEAIRRRTIPARVTLGSAAGSLLVAGAAPIGVGIYALFLWRRFGDPLLFAHTQISDWHHELWPPWRTIGVALQRSLHSGAQLRLDMLALFGVGALATSAVRRVPFAFTLYMAGLLYLCVAAPQPAQMDLIASAGRYLCLAVPVFIHAGGLLRGRPGLETVVLAGGFTLQAGLALVFLTGGPMY